MAFGWLREGATSGLSRDKQGVGLASQLEAQPRHTVLRATGGSGAPQTRNWKRTGWVSSLRRASPSAQFGQRARGAGAFSVCRRLQLQWRPGGWSLCPEAQADNCCQSP